MSAGCSAASFGPATGRPAAHVPHKHTLYNQLALSIYKVPLVLTPQPEGGYTVTSPVLPELVTEGDTIEQVLENVRDTLLALREVYEDSGRSFPVNLEQDATRAPIWFEYVIDAA